MLETAAADSEPNVPTADRKETEIELQRIEVEIERRETVIRPEAVIKRVVINGVETFYRTNPRRRFSRSSNIL